LIPNRDRAEEERDAISVCFSFSKKHDLSWDHVRSHI